MTVALASILKHFFRPLLGLGIVVLVLLTGCVADKQSGPRRGVNSQGQGANAPEPSDPTSPDFSSSLNFLQNGSFQSSSALNISIEFNDSLYLRGQQIDQFIKNGNSSTVQCLVVPFPQGTDRDVLVVAAVPRFFVNFTDNTREYYYLLNVAEKQSNQSFCLKTGLINQLSIELGTTDIAYSLQDLCTSCFESLFASTALKIYSSAGAPSTNISINYLSLRVTNTPGSNLPPDATCTSSSECIAKGFDCCSESQCVRDKQIKSSVDQSAAEFLQALSDIQANSSAIFNYPRFFHLCSQNIPTPDTPPISTNPEEEAAARLTRLQELYQCTTLSEGEQSICTVNFEDASEVVGGQFFTGDDDRNFNSTYTGSVGLPTHSLQKIIYAGEVLFELGKTPLNGAEIGLNNSMLGNDNFDDPLLVTLTKTPSPTAPNDTLKISYKIDGSCEKISTGLGRCTKFYVQGQNLGRVDDHFPASNQFLLPYYADINRTIKVEVDNTPKLSGSQWNVIPTSPAYIEFNGAGLQVFDTQKIAITFFVDLNSHQALLKKQEALDRIKDICQCANDECRLRPVTSPETNILKDFACVYPQPDAPPPPLQQTVLMSSKTVPHLYFDQTGVYQPLVQIGTPAQEGAPFEYINNDLLRPNNITQNIGFNEIYGSFNNKPGQAKPAKEVRVQRGKTYDLFVDTGSFSSCLVCGNDYFTSLKRLFPNSFGNPGGGYSPNISDTDRTRVTDLRGDDLIFGRACFVPATMIPWSHTPVSDLQTQRLRRLQTQHFLFANGLQRDWYGFDYGSIIGSFDGVKWFSVGTQRRIKATSSRLFLAVNAHFGDLTQESTFKIVVSDASNIPASGSTVSNDFDSDGAQCQQVHTCQTDSDCATTLGWEYSCQSITNLSSNWPVFDANGQEIPNAASFERLQALFGATKGGVKRCVYRGRGTPCLTNLDVSPFASTFNGSVTPGLLGCSANNYCQVFSDGSEINRFNTKISRFGRSVANQNASQFVAESNLDTFGLSTRSIGRPMSYNGTEVIPTEVLSNMNVNNINAMCLPGRNPQSLTINSQNSSAPTSLFLGDKILSMGVTASGTLSPRYLSACSIFDTDNNYYHFNPDNILESTQNTRLQALAGTQVLPTNSLEIFEQLANTRVTENFEAEQITNYILQENRCLRAPGSVCQTDQDCAPNQRITSFMQSIDPNDTALHDSMNFYELLFWREKLVCSQATAKTDPTYDLNNNRCCRETGNLITIGTFKNLNTLEPAPSSIEAPRFNQEGIPGVTIDLNNPQRSSRLAPARLDMFTNPTQNPPLQSAGNDLCDLTCQDAFSLDRQYNTLDKTARRTCCSGHWIRHWDQDQNGGGHRWEPGKVQNINKTNFQCLNWVPNPAATGIRRFNCQNSALPTDPDCYARAISTIQAEPILKWASKFELTGIPQVAIESDDFAELDCSVVPNDPTTSGSGIIIPGFLATGLNTLTDSEYLDGTTNRHYYASDEATNFQPTIKKVFSKDKFSCCLPVGAEVPVGSNRDQCCTGFINGQNGQCALPDYTNISLYLNRYVSSEGAGLDDSLYDEKSGFIKSVSTVEQLACSKKICASGKIARGIVLSPLKIRGQENTDFVFRRFLDGNDESNDFSGLATLFDEGLKWNNHVYCVPAELESDEAGTIITTQCPQ